jgi:hypothetical protein
MSLYDYRVSREITARDYPFAALIMAAMRQADTHNAAKLRQAFPHIHNELLARYYSLGGYLPGEHDVADSELSDVHDG